MGLQDTGPRSAAMTRGRHPIRALERAGAIAKKRGRVLFYERGPDLLADFTIATPPCEAQVKIKRMRYIRCSLPWLEREAFAEIAGLKLFPSSREISRELWTCSPDYCLRFFRVCDNGLAELDRDGALLPANCPAPGRRPRQKRAIAPAGKTVVPIPSPGVAPPCELPADRSPSEDTLPGEVQGTAGPP